MALTVVYEVGDEIKAVIGAGSENIEIQEVEARDHLFQETYYLIVVLAVTGDKELGLFSSSSTDFNQCFQQIGYAIKTAYDALQNNP